MSTCDAESFEEGRQDDDFTLLPREIRYYEQTNRLKTLRVVDTRSVVATFTSSDDDEFTPPDGRFTLSPDRKRIRTPHGITLYRCNSR